MDSETQWRGQPDTRRWRFFGLVALSLLLHALLTPWAALLGLLGLIGLADPIQTEDLPPITAIPVDLIEEQPVADSAEGPNETEPSGTPGSGELVAEEADDAEQEVAKETAEEGSDTESEDAGESEADETAEEVGDPVALSGAAGKLADTNANVRIKVDTEKVRRHPLGPRIGQVLARVPQWHDFLGPADLDPVRDIDRLLIAGPQLRDSSEVIAVLKYNVEPAHMEAAIDSLVRRSSGQWLQGPPKAATARADRAERVFSFIAPGLVAIVPPSAKADALKSRPKGASFPAIPGDAVLTAFVLTPHRVYTGLPFKLPESIKWVRASVTPDAQGGAVARIEAEDASPEDAAAHAAWLERRITSATSPKGLAAAAARFLYGGDEFLDRITFEADGSRINGELSVTAAQLTILLSMVEGIINSWNPKPVGSAERGAPFDSIPSAAPPTVTAPGGSIGSPSLEPGKPPSKRLPPAPPPTRQELAPKSSSAPQAPALSAEP